MAPYDDSGRIPRQAFSGSILVLFVLSLLCVGGRFYTKLRILKQRLGFDDAFILFGTCCMVCSVGLLYAYIDDLYLVEGLVFGVQDPSFIPPADAIERSFYFQRMVAASLVLSWTTITCVKFSFLALFRSLIDRLPLMLLYWKFVVFFNVIVCIYSAIVYLASCPYFGNLKALSCSSGPGGQRTVRWALAQMPLDIVGDITIVWIPIRLIWQIQLKWTQKIGLAASLCLIIVMIVFTVIRISGIHLHGNLDNVWEVYWQILAAETGLILTAMTAFRSLFVSSRTAENKRPFWHDFQSKIYKALNPWSWLGKSSRGGSHVSAVESADSMNLPSIPGGTLSGMRTFIRGRGRSSFLEATEGQEDNVPFKKEAWQPDNSIAVRYDLSTRTEHVSASDV